ncbi:hypothetical protein BJG93_06285 [Paraburkholderia sprentiae WSM5005]|uniref:Lipoprotein n=1 Tax=Paraburkholderia sprentiae WSM5005 TaxID=754502 RepID=A0A1I9YFE6_9BURK|nr:hypothetical protein [Paraburkholderia sprentiae]APA85029.1 hypothetical protein BJG93_06285 [Paraburkholderia sprentiae WSM5005]
MQFTTQPRRAGRFHRLRPSAALALVRRASLSAVLPAALLLAAGLGGCASSNTTTLINLPNGQTGFAVNCSGADAGSSWASCYVQAGKACGATGYDIVSKDNDEGGTAGGSVTNVVSANVKNRSMIVRCK